MFKNLNRGLLPTYHFAEESDGAGGDAPVSIVGADGSFAENWTEGEAYKADAETLSRYKTLPDVTKALMESKRKLGKDPSTLVEIPSENSSDEVRAAWAKAHNIPDSIEGYEYALSDEMAVKLGPLDDKNMGMLREFAQKKNWSAADFKEVLDLYHTIQSDGIDAAGISFKETNDAARAEGMAELKKEWLDGTDDRVLRANAVMRKYGGEEAVAELMAENNPKMIKFLDNIAEAMSEDTLKGLGAVAATSADIKAQLSDVRAQMEVVRKENPVNYKGNPKWKELTERKHALYKKMPA